jgi:hypothetical protein
LEWLGLSEVVCGEEDVRREFCICKERRCLGFTGAGEVDSGRKHEIVALAGKAQAEISEVGDLDYSTTELFPTFEEKLFISLYYIISDLVLSR